MTGNLNNIVTYSRNKDDVVDLVCHNLSQLPDVKYDIIYFLCCLQYMSDPKLMMSFLYNHLTDNGRLIMECKFADGSGKHWVQVQKENTIEKYPTEPLLIDIISEKFQFRRITAYRTSESPFPHVVYYCNKTVTDVIFVQGKSGTGKSSLARMLSNNKQVVNFSLDYLVGYIKNNKNTDVFAGNLACNAIREKLNVRRIGNFFDEIDQNIKLDFVKVVYHSLPLESRCIIVEGYPLTDSFIREKLTELLKKKRIRVWDISRLC